MRKNFQSLADKFSVLNAQDNKHFLSFYETNESEIEALRDFETDEELYLAVVINHIYGRSQLYERKDLKQAEQFLNKARALVLDHKEKFKIALNEDVWYRQSLQHLLTIYSRTTNRRAALCALKELKVVDPDNLMSYEFEEKELIRIRRYNMLLAIVYSGGVLVAMSIIYQYTTNKALWYVGRIGQVVMLGALVAAYFFKDTLKTRAATRKS